MAPWFSLRQPTITKPPSTIRIQPFRKTNLSTRPGVSAFITSRDQEVEAGVLKADLLGKRASGGGAVWDKDWVAVKDKVGVWDKGLAVVKDKVEVWDKDWVAVKDKVGAWDKDWAVVKVKVEAEGRAAVNMGIPSLLYTKIFKGISL